MSVHLVSLDFFDFDTNFLKFDLLLAHAPQLRFGPALDFLKTCVLGILV